MAKRIMKRIAAGLLIAVAALFLLLQGFVYIQKLKVANHPGNQDAYSKITSVQTESPLSDKKILFLGSSVTKGEAAKDRSFVEYLSEETGVDVIKDSRSGTTLVDEMSPAAFVAYGNGESYIARLHKIDTDDALDAVVVQLSTNDATLGKPLGEISETKDLEDQDKKTITGALEYILAYTGATWDCPVIFYTNAYYDNDAYGRMIDRLYQLQEKWDFGIIDLYQNDAFNDITESQRQLYMYDDIHPTQAGYRDWWLPQIRTELEEYLGNGS